MNNHSASLEITVHVHESMLSQKLQTCFGQVIEKVYYNTIFTLNFHKFLHTMSKYVLNSVAKISMMFAKLHHYT